MARLRRTDLWWLLAYPVYQLVGTLRHEASHAAMARLEGATVREFVFLPRIDGRRGPLWGFVRYDGATTWLTTAAPYFGAFLSFVILFPACLRARSARWLSINLAILGVVSPLVDTAYAYVGGLFRPFNDVAVLLREIPPWAVHVCFLAAITTYAVALLACVRSSGASTTEAQGHAGG